MERKRSDFLPGFIIGMNLMSLIHVIFRDSDSDIEQKVREAQAYNTQIEDQLTSRYSGDVRDLIIELDGKTYGFVTEATPGRTETCTGTFEVNKGQAMAVGQIACTVTQTLDGVQLAS
jgi:hypothetical protein